MHTLNIQFTNNSNLITFILKNNIIKYQNILIQIFSGIVDETKLLQITALIQEKLPQSNIIGTTTAGEIENGKIFDETIQISFSLFESTLIRSKLFNLNEPFNIEDIQNSLVMKNTKALIIFSDGLKSNAEELLNKLNLSNPNILIAGGRAADFIKLERTFIFNSETSSENGFVIASLSGDSLIANSDYMLNWNQIGPEMTVTKAEGNVVYEIDNIEIQLLYKKYLGSDISDNLPSAGTEFPLLTIRNGIKVARSPIAVLEDGSLLFGGNLSVGEKVMFAYGNLNDIQHSIYDNNKKFSKLPIESIFIYSCSGRKTLMGKELEAEFQMLNSLGPTVGYFTYGEYFHSSKINEVLNITTTFLALSEDSQHKPKKIITTKKYTNNRVLKALTHLTKEIDFKNRELSRLSDIISKSVLHSTSDKEGNIVTISKAYLNFLHLEEKDVIGKNHNIFRHPDTLDSFYRKMWNCLNANKRFVGDLKNKHTDDREYWIKIIINPIFDKNKNKIGYSSYREDITDKKDFEYLSAHDSLTKLYNKSEFTNRIKSKIKSAQRYKEEFGFIIFDIDHFKKVNDIYGHKVGDDILIKLSRCLLSNIRDDDFLARWGGEEFVVIANYTTIENLIVLTKKLQKEIAKVSFDPVDKITLSFGLSVYKEGDTKESLFERTDKALYMAKENGRDRYEVVL